MSIKHESQYEEKVWNTDTHLQAGRIHENHWLHSTLTKPKNQLEGAAEWSATGLENQGFLTDRGSIPPLSAFKQTKDFRQNTQDEDSGKNWQSILLHLSGVW